MQVAALATKGAQAAVSAAAGVAAGVTAAAAGEARRVLEAFVKQRIQGVVRGLVSRLPELAKGALEDRDMPRCASRGKDRLIDSIWPELEEEIMMEVALALDGTEETIGETRAGPDCIRAFFRYHLYPFDRSIWAKLRDPVWICWTLFTLTPAYGISPFCFFTIFLIIDKGDEFQLIQFILSFKGTQFITVGLLSMFRGFFSFLSCLTGGGHGSRHDCDVIGPGVGPEIWLNLAAFVFQVSLTWLCFVMLRCSEEKGRRRLKGSVQHDSTGHGNPGGLIVYFLWYDLAIFAACCGAVVYALSTHNMSFGAWPVQHVAFAAQVTYGLCSVPFFIFSLPLLNRVLTHSVPTAYDQSGVCRHLQSKKEPPVPATEEVVSESESQKLIDQIRELLAARVNSA